MSIQPLFRQAEYRQDEDPRSRSRKVDTPEYVNKMQQKVFEVLVEARGLEELQRIEPKARDACKEIPGKAESCHRRGAGHPWQGQQAELFEKM